MPPCAFPPPIFSETAIRRHSATRKQAETHVAGLTTDGDEKQKLWPYLLALAVVIFGIETLLANKGIARREIT